MKSTESTVNAGLLSLRKKHLTKMLLHWKSALSCLVFGLVFLAFAQSSFAQEVQILVQNRDKEAVLQLDFYDGFDQAQITAITEAAQYWVDILKAHGKMPNQLDQNGNIVIDANGNPVTQPVIYSIYYNDANVNNAWAMTNDWAESNIDLYNVTLPQVLIADGQYAAPVWSPSGYLGLGHGTIEVGSGFNAIPGNQSQSGRIASDLTTLLIHEIGHSLGVMSSTIGEQDPVTFEVTYRFPELLARYDTRLRDNNGNSPLTKSEQLGKEVGYDDTANKSNAGTIFDMGDPYSEFSFKQGFGNPSHPTFVGKNTLELWYNKPIEQLTLKEKNNGVPLQGYIYAFNQFSNRSMTDLAANPFEWYFDGGGTLSHINTSYTTMSWQAYRNYPGFIEIELAVLQDIGYTVERRDFFGKSFYTNGDGTPFYNSTMFGYWDAAKQGYDMLRPNDSTFAVGTHLFAKDLNVIQTGSIWANGPGSAGIRIDGTSNKLTVATGTNIRTDGVNGIGVLTANGKDHSIILQQESRIHAMGEGGIGVSFNFGEPYTGDKRGSYYYGLLTDEVGIPLDYPPRVSPTSGFLEELFGPLAKSFDVSGKITGSKSKEIVTLRPWWVVTEALHEDSRRFAVGAAVYIDGTAQVDKINIMNGAEINGDILSFHRQSPAQDTIPSELMTDEFGNPTEEAIELLGQYANKNVLNLTTEIAFGYKADASGAATNQVDNNFRFTFKDNINYFRYEVIPNILYLDPQRVIISPTTANSDPKLREALRLMGATINERGDIVDIPLGYAQGTGFYPGDMGEDAELDEDGNLPEDRGYWVSPAYNLFNEEDTFWHFLLWDDGFMDYQFAGGNISATVVRPGNGKVYADIVTPGLESTNLHFAAGITEFQGNTTYAQKVTIDRGATLTLTPTIPAQDTSIIKVKLVDTNGNPYIGADGNPLVDENGKPFEVDCLFSPVPNNTLKIPEINIGATFNPQVLPDINPNTLEPTVFSHPNPPAMDNFGRISGEGVFRLGQRRFLWDGNTEAKYGLIGRESFYWDGTLKNEGVISPGAKDGAAIGIINVVGDLSFGNNSVYEVTVGGGSLVERYTSAILPDGKYIDEQGNVYDPTIGQVRGLNINPNTELAASLNTNPNIDPQDLPIFHNPVLGTDNDLLVVLNNTKMDGTLKINFLADRVFGKETTTHTIIQSGTFTPTTQSNFKYLEYDEAFLYVSDVFINPYNSHEAQFTVIRDLDYFKNQARTYNEKSVATAIDNSLFERPDIAFSLGDRANPAADLRDIYRQAGASIRANSALINLWSPSEVLFNRIGYGNGGMPTGERGRVNWNRMAGRTQKMLGQAPGQAMSGQSCEPRRTGTLWGDFLQTNFNAESDGNSDHYNISRSGFMVGGEWNLTPYSAIGAIASYANSNLKQTGDKTKSDDYILGAYLTCAPMNEFEFKSYIGLGFQEYDMNRYVRNANIVYDSTTGARGINDHYVSDTQGNTLNVSFELARPLMLHRTFILRPTLGLDLQYLWQDGFTEKDYRQTSDSYDGYRYGLRYNKMDFHRTLFRAGFSSETTGFRGGIRMRAFYVTNVDGDGDPVSQASFVGTNNIFAVRGTKLGRNFMSLGVGANYWLDGEKTSSLFLDYDANIYNSNHRIDAHTFSIGLLQNF